MPPSSSAVGFMERIVPRSGNTRNFPGPSLQGEDENGVVSLDAVVPGADILNGAIKMGKMEDGKLVVPEGEDSDDQGQEGDEEGEESQTAIKDEKKKMKSRKEDMLQKLISGDIGQLIQEEEDNRVSGPRAVRKSEEPPVVKSTSERPVVERDVGRQVVEKDSATTQVDDNAEPPKKMSKFKAARLAAKGQL